MAQNYLLNEDLLKRSTNLAGGGMDLLETPSDFGELAQQKTGLLDAAMLPQQERDRIALEERLFAQGRLGSSTGGVDQGMLEDSISRQRMQTQLAGLDLARDERDSEYQRGLGLVNLGMDADRVNTEFGLRVDESAQRRDENALDRLFSGSESELDRSFRAGESAADRAFRLSESESQQEFMSGENELDRAANWRLNQANRPKKKKKGFLKTLLGTVAVGAATAFGGPIGGALAGSIVGGFNKKDEGGGGGFIPYQPRDNYVMQGN